MVISSSGAAGSSITSIVTNVNNQQFNSSDFTTGVLVNSGNITLTTTVTDSRGRTATSTKTISVIGYTKPRITAFTALRNASNGTIVNTKFSASITSLGNKNNKSFIIKYDNSDKATYTDVYEKTNQTYNITGVTEANSHIVTLVVSDYFSTVTETVNINTLFVIEHVTEDGKHISYGRYV